MAQEQARNYTLLAMLAAILLFVFELIIYCHAIWLKEGLRIWFLIIVIIAAIRMAFLIILYIFLALHMVSTSKNWPKYLFIGFVVVTVILFVSIAITCGLTLSNNKFYRDCPYTNYLPKIDEETVSLGMKDDTNTYFNKDECEYRRCIYYDFNPNSEFSKMYLCSYNAYKDKIEKKSTYYSNGKRHTSTYYVSPKNVVCTKAVNNIGVNDYDRYGKKEASFFFRDCAGVNNDLYYCSRRDYPDSFSKKIEECPGKYHGLLDEILFVLCLLLSVAEAALLFIIYKEFDNGGYEMIDY